MTDEKKRWTVAVDVDGVLHSYVSGWQGADVLPDPPVPGAIEWLETISKDFDVAICSTRCETQEGCAAVQDYLLRHGLPESVLGSLTIRAGKPPALLYIDDRGWRFEGNNFPSVQDIHRARPWWQSPVAEVDPDVGEISGRPPLGLAVRRRTGRRRSRPRSLASRRALAHNQLPPEGPGGGRRVSFPGADDGSDAGSPPPASRPSTKGPTWRPTN